MKHSISKLAVLALAVSGFSAQAQESDLEFQVDAVTAAAPVVVGQPLRGVVVTGNSNPLLRSDQRLAMLNASLPLDAKSSATAPTDLQRLAMLFPQEPNAAVGEARRMMERSHTPPAGSDPDGELGIGTR